MMRWFAALLVAVLLLLGSRIVWDDGALIPVDELNTKHSARGDSFYRAAADALGMYLQSQGFTRVIGQAFYLSGLMW
jgi:hypothetical protein